MNRNRWFETVLFALALFVLPMFAQAQELGALKGHVGDITALAFLPDGTLVSAGRDGIRLWDVKEKKEKAQFSLDKKMHLENIKGMAIAPDGKTIATASTYYLILWDVASGRSRKIESDRAANDVAWRPDGKVIAVAGDTGLRLWDAQTGKMLFELNEEDHRATRVAYSPDGKRLAVAFTDKVVRILNANTNAVELKLEPRDGYVTALVFTPNSKRIIVGSSLASENNLFAYDFAAKSGTAMPGHNGGLTSLAVSSDGESLFSAAGNSVRHWTLAVGKMKAPLGSHFLTVNAVAVSPDGNLVASGGEDAEIKLFAVRR